MSNLRKKALYGVEALLLIGTGAFAVALVFGFMTSVRDNMPRPDFSGVIDAEKLKIVKKSRDDLETTVQTMTFTNSDTWSGDEQIFVREPKLRDSVTFLVPRPKRKDDELIVHMTKSYDYGIIEILPNGGKPKKLSLFSNSISRHSINVGQVKLTGKSHIPVKFTVIGKDSKASHPYYQFGIDGFSYEPAGSLKQR